MTPTEKQLLKDEYIAMFKSELQKTKLQKSVDEMTIKEIKKINKEIARLQSKIARLQGEAVKITPSLSDEPRAGSVCDKIGNAVTQIADAQQRIQELRAERNAAYERLSRDVFEENCIVMRLFLHYSWTKIALLIGGDNTADSIRKMCERYSW